MKTNKTITNVLFALIAVFSTVAIANEIYIEQVGDSSTITVTQEGTGNKIGDSLSPIYIGSGSNTVSIEQIGANNELAMVVNGASTNVTSSVTGSGNSQEIQCGTTTSSGCSGSTITQTITGDDNIVKQLLGTGANHTSNITVAGDTNTVTHTSTASGTTSADITVTGNLNTIGVTQSGMTTQSVSVNSTGNSSNITINQSN